MKYDYDSIIEYFKANEDANFVAFMRTAWHSYGVCASLLKLSESNEHLKGLLLPSVDDFESKKPLVNTDCFSMLKNAGVDYEIGYKLPRSFPKSKIKLAAIKLSFAGYYFSHSRGSRKIYVLNPMNTAKYFVSRLKKEIPNAKIISVIVDEGLGSYFRNSYNWAVEMYQNSKSAKRFLESFFNIYVDNKFKKKAKKRKELLDFNLLKGVEDGFAPNGDMPAYYKRVIENVHKTNADLSQYENSVIISAQLYYENGQIKNDYDLKIYTQIISELNKRGIKAVLKPHPRDNNIERYGSLNCFVDEKNTVSQESIIASLEKKPMAVLSYTSTSLVTTKLFYGVNAISLNGCIEPGFLQASLAKEFGAFNKTFGGIVDIPGGVDGVIKIIEKTMGD